VANILIASVKVPFTTGGQDVLVNSLLRELRAREHSVDTVDIPFSVQPKEGLLAQAAIWRSLDLKSFGGQEVDLLIATKFPSYYASHPKKSLWLVHQHRAIYDLYASQYSDFSDDPRDEALRRMLIDGDNQVISECSYVSGISKNVIDRLKNYNYIKGDVLYPPLSLAGQYRCEAAENYILSVGRLCGIKRVDMMIKAMPFIKDNDIKLKIVGTADESGIMTYYKNEIDKHHLWDRVEFLGRVSDEELLSLYAKALAVYYAPHNEDYGYVTLEALASGKPVISCTDSGGVLEFVNDAVNGFVTNPDSESVGNAINKFVDDKSLAETLGQKGQELIKEWKVEEQGWDDVIQSLLSPLN